MFSRACAFAVTLIAGAALAAGMHVTVKGKFRCYQPLRYSAVGLYHINNGKNHRLCSGWTDGNGAYSLSAVVDEALYDVITPRANLVVIPEYRHESAYRGSLIVERHPSAGPSRDRTRVAWGVKRGSITDFGVTMMPSRECISYSRLMQETGDFARNIGPVPAQVKLVVEAPVPNIRVNVGQVLVPKGVQIRYSGDTRAILYSFIRVNYGGSPRLRAVNARLFGLYTIRPSDKPTSVEYAFNWGWYRFSAGGGCPTPRPPGPFTVPDNVYLGLWSIYCRCTRTQGSPNGLGGRFKETTLAMFEVFRRNPNRILDFSQFEAKFNSITDCASRTTF